LQSIDELWMLHIDSMTKLREEVAFEWYAQKQPLVVYKEKAFVKFSDLLWDIEYKITKAIFSINTVVDDRKAQNTEVNEKDLVWILDELLEEENTVKNKNPLFADTNIKNKRDRIRV
jgi:preprotein translocase subunit SecA